MVPKNKNTTTPRREPCHLGRQESYKPLVFQDQLALNFNFAKVQFKLNGRTGFTQDDFSAGFGTVGLGIGGPHSRVWQWYTGTLNVSATGFPTDDVPIFRQAFDGEDSSQSLAGYIIDKALDLAGFYVPFNDFTPGNPNPWYYNGDPNSSVWEGIV